MQAYSQFQDGDSGQPQEQGNSNPYRGWQMAARATPIPGTQLCSFTSWPVSIISFFKIRI